MARMLMVLTLAMLLMLQGGCGGGGDSASDGTGAPGGGSSTPAPAAAFAAYRNTSLSGRLFVNQPGGGQGNNLVFDLSTGKRSTLPTTTLEGWLHWDASSGYGMLTRYTDLGPYADEVDIAYFDPVTLAATRPPVRISKYMVPPKLSPDGRYLLTFWNTDITEQRQLTVFDAATGAIVKRGSVIATASVDRPQATWLPDGRYVYLDHRTLWASSVDSMQANRIAELALPEFDQTYYQAAELVASPDGKRLAISWREDRDVSTDRMVWVVNADGTNLRRLTLPPDPTSALDFEIGNPVWSPDGRWLAVVHYQDGTVVLPIDNQNPFSGAYVAATTGCISQVLLLDPDGPAVRPPWISIDTDNGVKVLKADEGGPQWLTMCDFGSIAWVP